MRMLAAVSVSGDPRSGIVTMTRSSPAEVDGGVSAAGWWLARWATELFVETVGADPEPWLMMGRLCDERDTSAADTAAAIQSAILVSQM